MIAKVVADKIEDRTVGLDPTILLTIVSIIGAIFELYKQCNKKPSVNVDKLERWHLRRIIKHKLADAEMYEHIGHNIYDGILGLSPESVEQEYDEYLAGPVSWAKRASNVP